jgi:hypothetical protein
MYKLTKDPLTGKINYVLQLETMAHIPMTEENTDYQAYLKWLEEGNTPEPADNQG